MNIKGIDISKHNGSVDFNKVKAAGIQFVVIRGGFGSLAKQKDLKFEEHYAGAKAAGLPVGLYWYSYAVNTAQAKAEAEMCLQIIKGKQFEYPIFFDLEEKAAFNTGKENCSAMVEAFCSTIEAAGYFAGLYMSRSPLQTHITLEIAKKYTLWIAEYNSKCNYDGDYGMWQYTSSGSVNGVNGRVDMNECYIDYPTIIRNGGFNGFSNVKEQVTTPAEEKLTESHTVVKNTKFKVGDKVILNGNVYTDSYGTKAGQKFAQKVCTVTRVVDESRTAPYLLDNGLGWAKANDLSFADKKPKVLEVGARVQVNGNLYTTSYGEKPVRAISGNYTVTRIIKDRFAGVLLNGDFGWVRPEDCEVL